MEDKINYIIAKLEKLDKDISLLSSQIKAIEQKISLNEKTQRRV